ncbi:MAG: hypothetical protein MHM6MM_007521 [Cercozoa sp. M6MM]
MLHFRQLQAEDMLALQHCNLLCLPENYRQQYWLYHFMTWPQLSWCAEVDGRIVGYVLAMMNDSPPRCAHVTSLAVLRSHRKQGIASALMRLSRELFLFP